jgi:hypothetical protein
MPFTKKLLAAIALGCLAATTAATPAEATPSELPSVLVLTARTADQPAHTALLTCDPDGGTHPDAAQACRQLAGVDGDPARLPATGTHSACPFIVRPIDVTLTGLWRGRTVRFSDHYLNFCFRDNASGSLFEF